MQFKTSFLALACAFALSSAAPAPEAAPEPVTNLQARAGAIPGPSLEVRTACIVRFFG